MSYLDSDELAARVGGSVLYIELTDDDLDGETDEAVEDQILGEADALADGFAARGGYTTPLGTKDAALLTPFLLDICNYKLKARRGKSSEADEKLYNDAMRVLDRIANGTFVLPSGVGASGTMEDFGIDSQDRMFSRALLEDF